MNINIKNDSNTTLDFIHKKTEKLVTAIYMLSNFFPHQEPLRWEVRTFCLNLLGNISFVFYGKNSDTEHILKESINSINEIISRFEIAHISGLISTMNFSVLKNELVSLRDSVESIRKGGGGQNILITSDFFVQDKLLKEGSPSSEVKDESAGNPIAPQKQIHVTQVSNPKASHKTPPSGDIRAITPTARFSQERTQITQPINRIGHNESIASKRKGDRSEAILKILKKKDNLTVKDISLVISDCSEKTIQRELLALVDKNVLKKTGERRWSRYSLA